MLLVFTSLPSSLQQTSLTLEKLVTDCMVHTTHCRASAGGFDLTLSCLMLGCSWLHMCRGL